MSEVKVGDNLKPGQGIEVDRISKTKALGEKWVPILRTPAYDFDEESGKFLDSMNTVELQQGLITMKIRGVVVQD